MRCSWSSWCRAPAAADSIVRPRRQRLDLDARRDDRAAARRRRLLVALDGRRRHDRRAARALVRAAAAGRRRDRHAARGDRRRLGRGDGPYDARVSPDGLKVAYWFTGRRRFCLPIAAGLLAAGLRRRRLRVRHPRDRPARARRRARAAAAVVVRRRPRARCSATAPARGRPCGQPRRPRRGRRPGLVLLRRRHVARAGPARPRRHPARGGRGRERDPPVRREPSRRPRCPALRCVVPGGPYASPTWSPDGTMLAWEQADGVHVAGPVPDLRQPVPDCSVIAQRRLTAGTDPYWGARGRAGRDVREAAARQVGGAQACTGVPLAAGGAAPARERGAAAAADLPRAGARDGAR